MRARLIILAGLAFCALSTDAAGQVVLPWATPQQTPVPESESLAESQLPLARARVEGGLDVWVGQAVVLTVEAIVPTWFTSAPVFPQPEIKNAVTLSPEGAVNFVLQSSGKTFSAQSRRYLVYPQAEGGYAVHSLKVAVSYALPDGKPSPLQLVAAAAVRFEAHVPPGAAGAKYFLTTTGFQLTQSLSRKPDDLKVGDSLTRTITMVAENTVGISLPPLSFEAPAGIRVYPGVPKVTETAERGKVGATRTEVVAYVPEAAGQYELPGITIRWWNPQTKTMNSARLPPIELAVQATSSSPEVFASSQANEAPPEGTGASLWKHLNTAWRWVLPLLATTLLFLILRRVLRLKGLSLRTYLAERRRRKAEAEPTYFGQFRAAALSNDPRAALRHLMRWLDRENTRPTAPTLSQFVSESAVPELSEAIEELDHILFDQERRTDRIEARKGWSGRRLYTLVARARRLKRVSRNRQHQRTILIRSLN